MSSQTEPGWSKVSAVLHQLAQMAPRECDSPAVPNANDQASSSSSSTATTPKAFASKDGRERDYVRAVLDCYLWLPGTACVTSRHDRRCAEQLYRRGVSLEVVKSAMLVAVARRIFRRGGPLPRVRAIAYFLPVVEELLERPCEAGYVQYLERALSPLAAAKAAQNGSEKRSSPSS